MVEEAEVGVLVVGFGCSLRSPHIEQLGWDSGLGWAQFGQPHVDLGLGLFLWPLPLFFFLGMVDEVECSRVLRHQYRIYLSNNKNATTTGLSNASIVSIYRTTKLQQQPA